LQHGVKLLLCRSCWQLDAFAVDWLDNAFPHDEATRRASINSIMAGAILVKEEYSRFANAKKGIVADLVECILSATTRLMNRDTACFVLYLVLWVPEHPRDGEREVSKE